jgi:hypothetical protein
MILKIRQRQLEKFTQQHRKNLRLFIPNWAASSVVPVQILAQR